MKTKKIQLLKSKTISGLSALMVREILMKVFAVFGQILLVRFLFPSDFGLFAVVTFLLGVATIFTDFGFSLTIIQQKSKPTHQQLSTIFYIKFFITSFIVASIFFLAPLAAQIYRNFSIEIVILLRLIALTLFLRPLKSIVISLIEREMEYGKVSIIDLLGVAAYYTAAIGLAFLGFGVWSLIWAVIAKEVIELIAALRFKWWSPGILFRLRSVSEMFRIGIYYQLGVIFAFIHMSIIPVIAGIKTTPYQVGLLDWSQSVISIPRSLTDNLGRVSFTSFAKIQTERKVIARGIEQAFDIMSAVMIFFTAVIFSFGRELILFFLTEKWLPALPSLLWFASVTVLLSGTALMGQAIQATGNSKLLFKLSGVLIVIEWALSYILLSKYGFIGIAMGFAFGTILMFSSYIIACKKIQIPLSVRKMESGKILILFIGLSAGMALDFVLHGSFVLLIVKLFLLGLVFIAAYFFLARDVLIKFIQLIHINELLKKWIQ